MTQKTDKNNALAQKDEVKAAKKNQWLLLLFPDKMNEEIFF